MKLGSKSPIILKVGKETSNYTPDSQEYQQKSSIIEVLGCSRDDKIAPAFLGLGKALTANPRLSNKQKSLLVEALEDCGQLTYSKTFIQEERDPEEGDKGRWDIEGDGQLQAETIALVYQFSDLESPLLLADVVEKSTALMNKAHQLGTKRFQEWDKTQKPCLDCFQKTEWEIFRNRRSLVFALVSQGMISEDNGYYLTKVKEAGDLKNCYGYDQLLLLSVCQELMMESNPLITFKKLQEVLYLGYGMAMRDGYEGKFGHHVMKK